MFFKVAFTLITNTINLPMETLINNWYVSDAKKILKKHTSLKVVGITGSYGKTSVKYILNNILTQKFNVLMTPESYNTLMGVVRTVRESLKASHEVFICEMGAKRKGDIKEICQLVNPNYGLITSIGPQHLETFKTLDIIIKTKFELIDSLPSDGVAYLNYDNENVRSVNVNNKVINYGINNSKLKYWAEDIDYNDKGLIFNLCSYNGQKISLNSRLLGIHNVLNITAACAVGLELGVKENDIIHGIKQLVPIPHRLDLKTQPNGALIIDNAFNSNPEGANESLNVLNKFADRKKILITPGMIELGEKEYDFNLKFGEKAASTCDFVILVGKQRAIPMNEGLKNKKFNESNIYIAKNLNDALVKMREIITPKSVILFENDLPDNYET